MKIEVGNDKVVIDGYVNAVGRDSRPISSPSEVVEKARNGKLRGWSFGTYAENDEFEERAGDIPRRHLKENDIFEVSLMAVISFSNFHFL